MLQQPSCIAPTCCKYLSQVSVPGCVAGISDVVRQEFVYIGNNQFISTLSVTTPAGQHFVTTPLVFLHGVGTGVALWVLNLTCVSAQRTVYAVDMLGFGRSSRVAFSSDSSVAEMEFVESLEAWRQAVRLDTFILVGHCFGGYIATSYALRYPNHVRHLLIVDPWGFAEQHSEADCVPKSTGNVVGDRHLPTPLWVKVLALLLQPFNPFSALRVAGSWGMYTKNIFTTHFACYIHIYLYLLSFCTSFEILCIFVCHIWCDKLSRRRTVCNTIHQISSCIWFLLIWKIAPNQLY